DEIGLDADFSDVAGAIKADGAYAENKGNRVTGDVGEYKDSLSYATGDFKLTGDKAGNYKLKEDSTVGGSVVVSKAD
ncbi:hypothetical protein M3084_10960, partial [Succinatimonas hippei]|uniref:hypothetical protein n=1 Tax=Succinatimonas hippei TaxID=626938 RepID=UPI0020136644